MCESIGKVDEVWLLISVAFVNKLKLIFNYYDFDLMQATPNKMKFKGSNPLLRTSMSKKNIYIYSSDVASFIGQNPYDYVTPFERLWKKCDSAGYEAVLSVLNSGVTEKQLQLGVLQAEKRALEDDVANKRITKRQFTTKIAKVEEEEVKINQSITDTTNKIEDVSLSHSEKLQKHVGEQMIATINSEKVATIEKRQKLTQQIDALPLSQVEKNNLAKLGESFINKTHGTLKENDAIQIFEDRLKVNLDTSQQFQKALLHTASQQSKFHWFVCGKVDGLYVNPHNYKDNYIVEVKNRTKAFFNTLREYEKTQIHLYMYMLGIPNSKLVEHIAGKIRITEVYEDTDYTTSIINQLCVFIRHFETFMMDDTLKMNYITCDKDEKRFFIQKHFLTPVYNSTLNEEEDDIDCMIEESDDC
jgi:hypothetical protein